ncbi:MAG: hypothetical protein ACKO5Y_04530 [Bacteroidota bacterium]
MRRLPFVGLFVFVLLLCSQSNAQIKRMDGLLSAGISYNLFNFKANISELADSSATVSKSFYPSFSFAGDFSLTKGSRKKWRVIFGFSFTNQALSVNATDYKFRDQMGDLAVDPFVTWSINKSTAGARLMFSYNIQHMKKRKIFGFKKTSCLLYTGISTNLNWYGIRENTNNVNFDKKSFGTRLTEYQLVALGFTGFPFRKKVGVNCELAWGGPYFIKAGVVIGL